MKAVVKTVEPAEREARFDHIRPHYLEALTLVERLHRRLLDVIKDEFDRRGRADINSVQALLLYNVGDKELTAGELRTRGYYLGSNVSYNLKKLVETGFLDHQRSRVDRRSVRIKLTDKGREVRDIVNSLYQKHVRTVEQVGGINCRRVRRPQQGAAPARALLDRSNSLPALRGPFFPPALASYLTSPRRSDGGARVVRISAVGRQRRRRGDCSPRSKIGAYASPLLQEQDRGGDPERFHCGQRWCRDKPRRDRH